MTTRPSLVFVALALAAPTSAQTLVRDLTQASASSAGSSPGTAVVANGLGFGAGAARTNFPMPSSPSFPGLQLFAQYAVLDSAGSLFDGFALSEGLWLRLGN